MSGNEDKQVASTPQETPAEVVNEGQNKGTEHVFNEQTNYVPKRTIIMVYTHARAHTYNIISMESSADNDNRSSWPARLSTSSL